MAVKLAGAQATDINEGHQWNAGGRIDKWIGAAQFLFVLIRRDALATSVGVTPSGVNVTAPVVNVTAVTAANVTAPAMALTGNVAITGNLAVTGSSTVAGHVVLVA